ncbi:hypothetical protein AMECASPLE_009346 [Ameca splendens]|uniref:Uncharacterized protein n=1 Tax=Ameca splendens TaxID=208324 RepID=A0ABV0YB51_9TELE
MSFGHTFSFNDLSLFSFLPLGTRLLENHFSEISQMLPTFANPASSWCWSSQVRWTTGVSNLLIAWRST